MAGYDAKGRRVRLVGASKGLDEAWDWYKKECRRKKKRPCRRVRATARSRKSTIENAEKSDSLVVSAFMNHLADEIKRMGAARSAIKHLRLSGAKKSSFSKSVKSLGRMSSLPKKSKKKASKKKAHKYGMKMHK